MWAALKWLHNAQTSQTKHTQPITRSHGLPDVPWITRVGLDLAEWHHFAERRGGPPIASGAARRASRAETRSFVVPSGRPRDAALSPRPTATRSFFYTVVKEVDERDRTRCLASNSPSKSSRLSTPTRKPAAPPGGGVASRVTSHLTTPSTAAPRGGHDRAWVPRCPAFAARRTFGKAALPRERAARAIRDGL